MVKEYQITGMTCSGCEESVKSKLLGFSSIIAVEASNKDNTGILTMDHPIPVKDLQKALGGENSKYHISEIAEDLVIEEKKSWIKTYKPILLIFFYILGVSIFIQIGNRSLNLMLAMRTFMAGFFLVFSFFKLLNLKGFVDSYKMYDVIAKRIPVWGYIYAFLELILGIAYLMNFNPLITNLMTLMVMGISIIGVLQAVLNKEKIQCACLGAIFQLPMSTVTIIEDGLMILMSLSMLSELF